jgi:ABC-type thiamin/hydroxymethylpyrimidine transport system permease subunit
MSSRVQEKGHATGVANGDYIEVTLDSAVTVGNRLVISGGSYNSAQIDATFLSQPSGTATLGSFVIGHSEKRIGDGFSAAIASAVVTGAGTCTIRLNVTGNNYYNLYVAEWSGLGPAVYNDLRSRLWRVDQCQ